MNLKSFGCRFIYGSELEYTDKYYNENHVETVPGRLTWPLLVADHYGLGYQTYAYPGIGNLRILEKILAQSRCTDGTSSMFIINWTWLDRYDFVNQLTESWETILPGDDSEEHHAYYKDFYSQYTTMLTNASYILTAINTLQSKQIPFYMTLMDNTLFDPIDPNWQDPSALTVLQKLIKPYINWFDGLDFLSWSRKNNYPISENWHPLEQAHVAAADYIIKLCEL
jgi:hypothetical protein